MQRGSARGGLDRHRKWHRRGSELSCARIEADGRSRGQSRGGKGDREHEGTVQRCHCHVKDRGLSGWDADATGIGRDSETEVTYQLRQDGRGAAAEVRISRVHCGNGVCSGRSERSRHRRCSIAERLRRSDLR